MLVAVAVAGRGEGGQDAWEEMKGGGSSSQVQAGYGVDVVPSMWSSRGDVGMSLSAAGQMFFELDLFTRPRRQDRAHVLWKWKKYCMYSTE